MRVRRISLAVLLLGVSALAACSRGTPDLINLTATQSTPDEFSILPNKPIEIPADLTALPPPTPGQPSRVDPSPRNDAIVALGGRPVAGAAGGALRGDPAVVGYAARYGVAPDIRGTLAAEDLEFRRRNDGRLLERLFNVSTYFRAYEGQSLDQYLELRRLRAAGVRTPSAPPAAQ